MTEFLDISTRSLFRIIGSPSTFGKETGDVVDAASSLLDDGSQDAKSPWHVILDEKSQNFRHPNEDRRAQKLAIRKARNKQHAYNSRRRTAAKIESLTLENECLHKEVAYLREQLANGMGSQTL